MEDRSCGICENGKKYFLGKCIDNCSPFQEENGQCVSKCLSTEHVTTNKQCISCEDNKVFDNDQCIDTCPKGKVKNIKNECIPCYDTPHPYNDGVLCVANPKENQIVFQPYNQLKICDYYIYSNQCVKKCPSYTISTGN